MKHKGNKGETREPKYGAWMQYQNKQLKREEQTQQADMKERATQHI